MHFNHTGLQQPDSLNCGYAHLCSGCDRIFFDQVSLKENRFKSLKELDLPSLQHIVPEYVWIHAGGMRDRVDLILDNNAGLTKLGLFEKSQGLKSQRQSRILDLNGCPQLTPSLEAWLNLFREDLPPFKIRGSIRLRVSPLGLRGAWLDFSNDDIRSLLDEENWLERQLNAGTVIEVGQKRKRVTYNQTGPRRHRLSDPVLEPWFETVVLKDGVLAATPLYSTIGTFTQPGFDSNQILVKTMLKHLSAAFQESPPQRVAEFGSGIGNFTFPLVTHSHHVDVFESDRLAIAGLKRGMQEAQIDENRITLNIGDFIQSKNKMTDLESAKNYDLIFVDPPRSGLGCFFEGITLATRSAGSKKPSAWIYVSCFPESFAHDAKKIESSGYQLTHLSIVEQFPFTKHFELIATFSDAFDTTVVPMELCKHE